MKKVKTREQILKPFIISLLRRGTFRWKPRNEVIKEARVSRGMYKCALCSSIVRNKDKKVDHINPVVDPLEGFKGWDVYVDRMYPEKEGFQVICIACHQAKSSSELEIRKTIRKKNKGK